MPQTQFGNVNLQDPGQFQNIVGNLGQTSGDAGWKQNITDYNAATGLDVNGRYQGYNAARYLMPAEFANLVQQYATQAALGPMEQQALMDYMSYIVHPERMSEENRNRLFAQVPELTSQLQKQIASSGGSQAAQEGAAVNVFNNQRRSANEFDASLFSPSGRAQTAMGAIQVANAATPRMGNLESLHGITVGTPRNQTGAQAVGGILGSIAPILSGGSGGSIFGGGSQISQPLPSGGSSR